MPNSSPHFPSASRKLSIEYNDSLTSLTLPVGLESEKLDISWNVELATLTLPADLKKKHLAITHTEKLKTVNLQRIQTTPYTGNKLEKLLTVVHQTHALPPSTD